MTCGSMLRQFGEKSVNLHELSDLWASGKVEKHAYIRMMHEKHTTLFDYCDLIKKSDIKSLEIGDNGIVATLRESEIKLYLDGKDSRFVPVEILNFGSYESTDRDLLRYVAGDSRTIFDVGANIGYYTLTFSKLPNVEKVYSFEPIPRTFEYLQRHVALNRCENVTLVNRPLFDKADKIDFYWTELETGSASIRNIQDRSNINITTLETITMDEFVQAAGIEVDFVKCDVEGAELFVFRGGMKTLERSKPYIFCELLRKWASKCGYSPNDVIELLSTIGYKCYAYYDERIHYVPQITADTVSTNFFFFHEMKHGKVFERFGPAI